MLAITQLFQTPITFKNTAMKTPMQELIDKLKTLSPEAGKDSLVSQGYHEGIQWAIYFAQKYLEKEKKIIVDAFDAGRVAMVKTNVPQMPDIYYEKTFKQ